MPKRTRRRRRPLADVESGPSGNHLRLLRAALRRRQHPRWDVVMDRNQSLRPGNSGPYKRRLQLTPRRLSGLKQRPTRSQTIGPKHGDEPSCAGPLRTGEASHCSRSTHAPGDTQRRARVLVSTPSGPVRGPVGTTPIDASPRNPVSIVSHARRPVEVATRAWRTMIVSDTIVGGEGYPIQSHRHASWSSA